MTREEAIAVLESDAEYMYSQDSPYNREAYQMAVEALEAEPIKHCKPVVYYHGENTFSYECSICRMPIDEKDYYCRWCGAKIDKVKDPHKED